MNPQRAELEKFGRVWVRGAVSANDVGVLKLLFADQSSPGTRMAMNETLQPILGPDTAVTKRAQTLLPDANPVRIVSFNKTTDLNWSVPWHQDRVIAVREKHNIDGFTCWTKKTGFWHVEPPLAFLKSMFFARIHLDEETPSSGGLELALNSHHDGIVAASQAETYANNFQCETCHANPGDVVFIKALTLHRSAPSQTQHPRRTLRVDYCAKDLPSPLQWAI